VLQDGRFTVEEVGGLNVFIERMIEESGMPPLQIGFRISDFGFRIFHLPSRDFFGWVRVNSEFGIRNAARRAYEPGFLAGFGGNSKLKTQNSKLA
jgi:hypothetical protein